MQPCILKPLEKNTSGTVSVINGTIDGSLDMVQQGDITDSTYTSGNVELENLTINGNSDLSDVIRFNDDGKATLSRKSCRDGRQYEYQSIL